MFKLYKKHSLTSAWDELADMNLTDGESTIQMGITTSDAAIVINQEYCLSGTKKDLKQLKSHIDALLTPNSDTAMVDYENSEMDIYYRDDEASLGFQCKVTFGGGHIAVSYSSDGEHIVYSGNENESGHFELRMTSPNSPNNRATLHRLKAGNLLVGSWVEDNAYGMWEIRLEK